MTALTKVLFSAGLVWLAVSARIPPASQRVLVVTEGGLVTVAKRSEMVSRQRGDWLDDAGKKVKPTHWQQLPSPPKRK